MLDKIREELSSTIVAAEVLGWEIDEVFELLWFNYDNDNDKAIAMSKLKNGQYHVISGGKMKSYYDTIEELEKDLINLL